MTKGRIVRRSALRPSWPTRSANVLAAMTAALFVVSRTTGAGWMVVILCANLGILAMGVAAPMLALRRLDLEVRAPRDAVAGQALPLRISVERPAPPFRLRVVSPPGGSCHVEPPVEGDIEIPFVRRGLISRLEVEIAGAAPLGLVWWRRRFEVVLDQPVEVGPRRVDEPWSAWAGGAAGASGRLNGRHGGDMARGIRDYLPGDPARLVHWPATARRGQLVVKELEDPEVARLTVVVDVSGQPDDADEVAARALAVCAAALDQGVPVVLGTVEERGPVVASVASRLDASRRLARAVSGPPPEAGWPRGATVVRIGPT